MVSIYAIYVFLARCSPRRFSSVCGSFFALRAKNEPQIEIQNIVASASLGGKIHLELAARVLPRSMYEPEQFPGLIHRMLDPKTVILLFASGKLVCTGAKKESEVYRAVHNLHTLLEEKNLMIYEG